MRRYPTSPRAISSADRCSTTSSEPSCRLDTASTAGAARSSSQISASNPGSEARRRAPGIRSSATPASWPASSHRLFRVRRPHRGAGPCRRRARRLRHSQPRRRTPTAGSSANARQAHPSVRFPSPLTPTTPPHRDALQPAPPHNPLTTPPHYQNYTTAPFTPNTFTPASPPPIPPPRSTSSASLLLA